MAKDSVKCRELERWLIEAIGKIRRQKQRPNLDRICATIQQVHSKVTIAEISTELDAALKSGAVVCTEIKGAVSYREASHADGRHRRPSFGAKRSPIDLSDAVVAAMKDIGPGCSQEMIEKHVIKNCRAAGRLENGGIEKHVTSACQCLLASRQLSVRDGLYFLKSAEQAMASRASSSNLCASDGHLSSTTATDVEKPARCSICQRCEDKDGSKQLVCCVDCNYKGHASCMKLSKTLARAVRNTRWQCYDCKTCSICRSPGEHLKMPNDMIFCDGCDRGFHIECCKPPMTDVGTTGKWLCGTCQLDAARCGHFPNDDEDANSCTGDERDDDYGRTRKYGTTSPDDHGGYSSDIETSTIAPIKKRMLNPVVRLVPAQCSSDAVVGSSSDVASPRSCRDGGKSRARRSTSTDTSSDESGDEEHNHSTTQRPAGKPRGLVDALSRYFTPSDKRRSRVSLNALPQASPRSASSDSLSMKSAADTTRSDDPANPCSPPTKMHHKKFRRFSLHGNDSIGGGVMRQLQTATSKPPNLPKKFCKGLPVASSVIASPEAKCDIKLETVSAENDATTVASTSISVEVLSSAAGDRASDSKGGAKSPKKSASPNWKTYSGNSGVKSTSDKEPSGRGSPPNNCSSSKRKMVSASGGVKCASDAGNSNGAAADACDGNSGSEGGTRRKKPRRNQLTALQDSLSHLFSAEGDRKRTPASYVEGDYPFDVSLQPVIVRPAKRPRSGSRSGAAADLPGGVWSEKFSVVDKKIKPSKSRINSSSSDVVRRQSVFHLSALQRLSVADADIDDEDVQVYNDVQSVVNQASCCTTELVGLGQIPSSVTFGRYVLSPTGADGCSGSGPVYLCEFCLACLKMRRTLRRHMAKCNNRCPPGREIYRNDDRSVFEMNGNTESVYCTTLNLLATLFDAPRLSADGTAKAPTTFYVLTTNDTRGCHFVAFFSLVASVRQQCRLTNFLVLAPYQSTDSEQFLLHFGYRLCQLKGQVLVHSFWKMSRSFDDLVKRYRSFSILNYLMRRESCIDASIADISSATGICETDVSNTLKSLDVVVSPMLRDVFEFDRQRVTELVRRNATEINATTLCVKDSCLKLATVNMHGMDDQKWDSKLPAAYGATEKSLAAVSGSRPADLPRTLSLLTDVPKCRKLGRPKGPQSDDKKTSQQRRRGRPRGAMPCAAAGVRRVLSAQENSSGSSRSSSPSSQRAGVSRSLPASVAPTLSAVPMPSSHAAKVDQSSSESEDEDRFVAEMPRLERKDSAGMGSTVGNEFESRSPSPPMLEQVELGSRPDSRTDSRHGSRASSGSRPASPVSLRPGSHVSSRPGSPVGSHPCTRLGSLADSRPGSHIGSQPGSSVGFQPSSPISSRLSSPVGSRHGGSSVGSRPGSPVFSHASSRPASPTSSRPVSPSISMPHDSPQPVSLPCSRPSSPPIGSVHRADIDASDDESNPPSLSSKSSSEDDIDVDDNKLQASNDVFLGMSGASSSCLNASINGLGDKLGSSKGSLALNEGGAISVKMVASGDDDDGGNILGNGFSDSDISMSSRITTMDNDIGSDDEGHLDIAKVTATLGTSKSLPFGSDSNSSESDKPKHILEDLEIHGVDERPREVEILGEEKMEAVTARHELTQSEQADVEPTLDESSTVTATLPNVSKDAEVDSHDAPNTCSSSSHSLPLSVSTDQPHSVAPDSVHSIGRSPAAVVEPLQHSQTSCNEAFGNRFVGTSPNAAASVVQSPAYTQAVRSVEMASTGEMRSPANGGAGMLLSPAEVDTRRVSSGSVNSPMARIGNTACDRPPMMEQLPGSHLSNVYSECGSFGSSGQRVVEDVHLLQQQQQQQQGVCNTQPMMSSGGAQRRTSSGGGVGVMDRSTISRQPGSMGPYLSAQSPMDVDRTMMAYKSQQQQQLASLDGIGSNMQSMQQQQQQHHVPSPNPHTNMRQQHQQQQQQQMAFQYPPTYVDVGSPNMVGGYSRSSGGPPSVENVASPYAMGYRRMSAGSGTPHVQTAHISPEQADKSRMPSPSNYYVDARGQNTGYASKPIGQMAGVPLSGSGGPRPLSVKGSPNNCLEPAGMSPGGMLMSPVGSIGRVQPPNFNISNRSPAMRMDQSPLPASSGVVYSSMALGPTVPPPRQPNFNRPNPSPSAATSSSNHPVAPPQQQQQQQQQQQLQLQLQTPSSIINTGSSPLANIFSPSASIGLGRLSCSTPDIGLPFQFPNNVAVPVSAVTYGTSPSPTPHCLQLLSPSVQSNKNNNSVVNCHGQGVGSRHATTQHLHQAAVPPPPSSSSLGFFYCGLSPSPAPNVASYAGMLDMPLEHIAPSPAPACSNIPASHRQPRGRGQTSRAAPSNMPTDGSLAQLQQLTNRFTDPIGPSPPQMDIPYSMTAPQMSMILARNSMFPDTPYPPQNSRQPSSSVTHHQPVAPPCKQHSSRRRGGTSSTKSVATSVANAAAAPPLPFTHSVAAAAASYNMLGAFHQQGHTPHPSTLNYQQQMYLAAANGIFGQGPPSQLPMQMMPFGMPPTHPHAPSHAPPSNFVQSQQSVQQGQPNSQMYQPYSYGRVPHDSFSNLSRR